MHLKGRTCLGPQSVLSHRTWTTLVLRCNFRLCVECDVVECRPVPWPDFPFCGEIRARVLPSGCRRCLGDAFCFGSQWQPSQRGFGRRQYCKRNHRQWDRHCFELDCAEGTGSCLPFDDLADIVMGDSVPSPCGSQFPAAAASVATVSQCAVRLGGVYHKG